MIFEILGGGVGGEKIWHQQAPPLTPFVTFYPNFHLFPPIQRKKQLKNVSNIWKKEKDFQGGGGVRKYIPLVKILCTRHQKINKGDQLPWANSPDAAG